MWIYPRGVDGRKEYRSLYKSDFRSVFPQYINSQFSSYPLADPSANLARACVRDIYALIYCRGMISCGGDGCSFCLSYRRLGTKRMGDPLHAILAHLEPDDHQGSPTNSVWRLWIVLRVYGHAPSV